MKKFFTFLFALAVLTACEKPQVIPPGPDGEDTTITYSYPFETSRLDLAFTDTLVIMNMIDDRYIDSIESDAGWISALYRGQGILNINVAENKAGSHREGTLTFTLNTGDKYELAISQNARPHIEWEYDYMNEDMGSYGTCYVYGAFEMGEDVVDMRIQFRASGYDYYTDNEIKEVIAQDDSEGTVYTWEEYRTLTDSEGWLELFIFDYTDYSDNISFAETWNIMCANYCVLTVALDEHGNYAWESKHFSPYDW